MRTEGGNVHGKHTRIRLRKRRFQGFIFIAHPALVFVVRPLFQNRKEKNMHVFRNKSMGSKTKRGNTHVFSTYTRAFDKSIDNNFISTLCFFRLHTSITA